MPVSPLTTVQGVYKFYAAFHNRFVLYTYMYVTSVLEYCPFVYYTRTHVSKLAFSQLRFLLRETELSSDTAYEVTETDSNTMQRSFSQQDTLGTEESVLISEVS